MLPLLACGSERAQPESPAPEETESAPESPPGSAANPSPSPSPRTLEGDGYVIHEWGLISFGIGEPRAMATAGPGHFPVPGEGTIGLGNLGTVGLKPVLYAHLVGEQEEVTFSTRIRVPGGEVPEHWPDGVQADEGGGQVTWPEVTARGSSCEGSSYPTIGSERCDLSDGFCEAAELALYETDDAACLHVGDAQFNHLFYRAGMPTGGPLEVTMDGDRVQARHRGQHPLPGSIARVLRVENGRSRIVLVDPPAPGETITIDEPGHEVTQADFMNALDAHMAALGLTEQERAAFARAWRFDLVGGTEPSVAVTQRSSVRPLAPAPDALYFWLGPEDAEAILSLDFEPAPLAVRRALLARVHLNRVAPTPAGVRIRGGEAEVVGDGLSKEIIRRVVRRHLNEIRFCIEQEYADAALDVVVNVQVDVDGSGAVSRARIEGDALRSRARTCVQNSFERWAFPAPEGGEGIRFTYPLVVTIRPLR